MKKLSVGALQFAACGDVALNLAAIERGMQRARDAGVRLLLTQECSLCGYPPVERDSAASVDQRAQLEALARVSSLAQQHDLFVVVGAITPHGPGFLNSLCLVRPDGPREPMYHKRALWGWDRESFVPGEAAGVYEVDGVRVGTRVCYEVRFPEYFRELFRKQVDLALVALADVADASDRERTDVYRAHLVSRASENGMWVLSANSSRSRRAPACLIDPDGNVRAECKPNEEDLLVGAVQIGEAGRSAQGRIEISRALTSSAPGHEALVRAFYAEIWDRQDTSRVPELLAPDFVFRGSLGSECQGHGEFIAYVHFVHAALSDYRCQIEELISDGDRAFVRMRFGGVHRGELLGFQPTHRAVSWAGAAVFSFRAGRIFSLWVLGDVHGLREQLAARAARPS